jgi:hypothetical protein
LGDQKKVTRNPYAKSRIDNLPGWVVKLVTHTEISYQYGNRMLAGEIAKEPVIVIQTSKRKKAPSVSE